jgi:transposase
MSLKPTPIDPVPDETARVAQAAFPAGNLYIRLREELGTLFEDALFADLFPARGQPAEAPWRLALVSLIQFLEGLPDRQAAEAVRSRIDVKYLLGLHLSHPGFHYSVLSEFRSRLIAGGAESRLFEVLLTHFRSRGWLKERSRQRTDSTHILASIHALNRLELVGHTLQHALNVLAVAAPDWLKRHVGPDWSERYSRPLDQYRLPQDQAGRLALAEQIGADGVQLFLSLAKEPEVEYLAHLPALQTLLATWEQQYDLQASPPRWRSQGELPPSADRLTSPHDQEARYSAKGGDITWVGYKVHLTETCEDDTPHLITQVETTPATEADNVALPRIHQELDERALLPREHLVDTTYGSGELLLSSQKTYGVELLCPVRLDLQWQTQAGTQYDMSAFLVDWEAQQVICPQGNVSRSWKPQRRPNGKPTIQVQFSRAECRACLARANCTRNQSGPRKLILNPKAEHLALQAARERQKTQDFKRQYAQRAGIEGTLSQSAFALRMRRSRYRGLEKTHLQHVLTASAINLLRAFAWLEGIPRTKTRKSHFAALMAA